MAEYPERSRKAESEPKPRTISPLAPTGPSASGSAGSVATRAGWTPLCSRIQASCSARVRGTMSNVFVLSRTSTL